MRPFFQKTLTTFLFGLLLFPVSPANASKALTSPKDASAKAMTVSKNAPIAQVVNNSGASFYQVKVGNTVFSKNLSGCNGCSSGFKTVKKGSNRISLKHSATSSWIQIGNLNGFENNEKYAVNITKGRTGSICAELYQRKNTDLTFAKDRGKRKIASVCARPSIHSAGLKDEKKRPTGTTLGNARPAAGARAADVLKPSSPTRMNGSTMQRSTNRPVITNISFGRAQDTTSMVQAPGAATSSDRTPRIRAQFGTRVTLGIRFTVENTSDVRLFLLDPSGGHQNIREGEGRDLGDGRTRYIIRHEFTATESKLLTLRIRATGTSVLDGFATEERQVDLNVRSPRIRINTPELDNGSRQLTFSIRNNGNMDLPSGNRITYEYRIFGMPGNQELRRGSVQSSAGVPSRGQISFDPVTVPENGLEYDSIKVESTVLASCNLSYLPTVERVNELEWELKTLNINEGLLSIFSGVFSGNIHVNTFDSSTSSSTSRKPYIANDSSIVLNVEESGEPRTVLNRTISIPSFKFGSDGVEAFVFIDNIDAPINGRDLFFIRDGKLGLRIEFDCSASREIEVWARDAIGKKWRDKWLPDLELTGFSIELLLTPVKKGQTISYDEISMNVNVNLDMPGHHVEHWLEDVAAREIRNGFRPMFESADVKEAIENTFSGLLNNGLINVRHLVDVVPSGNRIVVHYR